MVFLIDLSKQLEHIGLVFLVYSDTSVEDLKLDCIEHRDQLSTLSHFELTGLYAQLDVSFKGKLGRVPQNVDQYLLEALVVTLDNEWHMLRH